MRSVEEYQDIWNLVGEEFDERLPRRWAVLIKPRDDSLSIAYPIDFSFVGYCFDFRTEGGYEEKPSFEIKFSDLIYPSITETIGKPKLREGGSKCGFTYTKQMWYPSLITRNISYSSIGLVAKETFARVLDDAFTWRIVFQSKTLVPFTHNFYTVVSTAYFDKISVQEEGTLFKLAAGGDHLAIKTQSSNWGTYTTIDDYQRDISQGKLNREVKGKYLLFSQKIKVEPGKSTIAQIGVSINSTSKKAEEAYKIKDIENSIKEPWNKWFFSLPKIDFTNEAEKKAYYKCWWIIKLNCYNHPQYGRTVVEGLPVYRAYSLSGLPAMEWYSDQDKKYTSNLIKKTIDMFLEKQREDGHLPHGIYLDGIERWGEITMQPTIAWAALRYYYVSRDEESIRDWYPKLVKAYEYFNQSRDKGKKNIHLWAAISSHDTGLDTIPPFDDVEKGREEYCYPSIFAAERFRYEMALAKMAKALKNDKENMWYEEAKKTKIALDKYLWGREKKWYGILHENGNLDTRVGIDGLFPFAYRIPNLRRAQQARNNFEMLIGKYGVHSISPSEPGFSENHYWRGPSWASTCSHAVAAAYKYFPDLTCKICQATIRMLLRYPNIWECMNAINGTIARDDLGWLACPGISSNQGGGGDLGTILTSHGIDMFSIEDIVRFVNIKGFHWAGLWLDILKKDGFYEVKVKEGEKKESLVNFEKPKKFKEIMDSSGNFIAYTTIDKTIRVSLIAGNTYRIIMGK